MAVPKFEELMKPLLEAVKDGKEYKINVVTDKLAEQLKLSADDRKEMLPSGRQTIFKDRVGWAKFYLKKAGLLKSPDYAVVVITDDGKKALAEGPDKIDLKYLKQFDLFVDFKSGCKSADGDRAYSIAPNQTDSTPDDQFEDAYNQINASLADELLSEVLKLDPYLFEQFVVDLLCKMGYGAAEYGSKATVATRDNGIDGVIVKDKLGFSIIYIQAKKWNYDVGPQLIKDFVKATGGKAGDKLFVTTSKFTNGAEDCAKANHIILIDGKRLANLMIEYNFCVNTRKTFEIKYIDTEALSHYQKD